MKYQKKLVLFLKSQFIVTRFPHTDQPLLCPILHFKTFLKIEYKDHYRLALIERQKEITDSLDNVEKMRAAEAEKELARIEQELKDKMLTMAGNVGKSAEELAAARNVENN